MFDNNFGKCERIFKILSRIICQKNYLCTYRRDFHLAGNMLLHYLVKVGNPKMLLILTASSTNSVDMFLKTF